MNLFNHCWLPIEKVPGDCTKMHPRQYLTVGIVSMRIFFLVLILWYAEIIQLQYVYSQLGLLNTIMITIFKNLKIPWTYYCNSEYECYIDIS